MDATWSTLAGALNLPYDPVPQLFNAVFGSDQPQLMTESDIHLPNRAMYIPMRPMKLVPEAVHLRGEASSLSRNVSLLWGKVCG